MKDKNGFVLSVGDDIVLRGKVAGFNGPNGSTVIAVATEDGFSRFTVPTDQVEYGKKLPAPPKPMQKSEDADETAKDAKPEEKTKDAKK